jgi:glycerol kinase
VWPNAESFMESRKYTRFAPGEGARAAQAAMGGWHRAVRAAVGWAKDTDA